MAGMGFELKKIYGRKTLAANLWGTFYATMTTIGPAVLSAVLILVLKLMLDNTGLTIIESRFYIASTTYAFIIATIVAVIFSAPVSRYISDCIYLNEEENICPSLFGVLTLATVLSSIVMIVLCTIMYTTDPNITLSLLVIYYFLGVLVTNTYCIMTYASALKHYKELTFAFVAGALFACGIYLLCTSMFDINKIEAACAALMCCYLMIVFMMVLLCVKTFGISRRPYFDFLSYFGKYPNLTAGSIAYTVGIFAPTIMYWIFAQSSEQISIFHTYPAYDLCMFLAIVVNMPSMVIFVVKVETTFYDKYTQYVSALNNGSYNLIERERIAMTESLRHQLFFVYEIQLIITVILACLMAVLFPFISMGPHLLNMFVLLCLGIYAVFCMYFTIVVFYYFSDYTGACIGSLVFFVVTVTSAAFAIIMNDYYSVPLLLGGLSGWIVSFMLLRRRMERLDSFLMC